MFPTTIDTEERIIPLIHKVQADALERAAEIAEQARRDHGDAAGIVIPRLIRDQAVRIQRA